MSRFEGEPPFDQSGGERSRPLSLREQVASALGINREPAYMLTDSEILSAILELRANGAEDARQLQEAQDKYSEQLEEARMEYVRSRADCDARCERLTVECATARADRNEARAERSRAWRERDEVRVECDDALAECKQMRMERNL